MKDPFSISPASTLGPSPVRLTVPVRGYHTHAVLTDDCGKPIPGATLTVAHRTATPHFPAGFTGTAYVQWVITKKAHATVTLSLSLAAKEVIGGKATTCPRASAFEAPKRTTHTTVAAPAPGHTSSLPVEGIAGGALALALVAALVARRARRHPRGSHR